MSAVSGSSTTGSSTTPPAVTTNLTTGANGVSTFNISGLASGLDDNEIITELMSIASLPETNIENQITLETTRQSDLQAIQTQLGNLSTAISELVDPSTWSTSQQISSSDPTNVSATGGGVPPGGYEVSVQQLARAAQMTQTSSMTAAGDADQLQIQIGSATAFNVNVHAGDSLQTIANSINSSAGTQLFASVVNSKLVLSSEVTGSANTISVASTGGGTVAADLGLTQTVSPRDAIYSLDGGSPTTSASNTVTTIATGLTVTLQGITTNPATITVAQAGANTSGVETAIENFVTAYNATVTAVSSKLNEQKVVNPSTDADRAMGDLNGDPGLESLLTQLRESVGERLRRRPGGDERALAGGSLDGRRGRFRRAQPRLDHGPSDARHEHARDPALVAVPERQEPLHEPDLELLDPGPRPAHERDHGRVHGHEGRPEQRDPGAELPDRLAQPAEVRVGRPPGLAADAPSRRSTPTWRRSSGSSRPRVPRSRARSRSSARASPQGKNLSSSAVSCRLLDRPLPMNARHE